MATQTGVLFQLGAVQFTVAPLNVSEIERDIGADFAAKDIIGAQRPREFVGASDEPIRMFGKLFPHRLGGLDGLSQLEAMAVSGKPQMLVRGDGVVFGWYLIERLRTKSEKLNAQGVGRMIDFEIMMTKSPTGPSASDMMQTLTTLFT